MPLCLDEAFKSFANVAITVAGIELVNRIRKWRFSFGRGHRRRGWSQKAQWAVAPASGGLLLTQPESIAPRINKFVSSFNRL